MIPAFSFDARSSRDNTQQSLLGALDACLSIPLEHHLHPQAQNRRHADTLAAGDERQSQDRPLTNGESFSLSASDHLYVGRQHQPRRDRDVVKSFETVLIAQQLDVAKQTLELRIVDVDVVKSKAVAITFSSRNNSLAADPQAVEEMHEVGIAVRCAEAAEDADAFARAFLRLVENVSRTCFTFERAVLEDEARGLGRSM